MLVSIFQLMVNGSQIVFHQKSLLRRFTKFWDSRTFKVKFKAFSHQLFSVFSIWSKDGVLDVPNRLFTFTYRRLTFIRSWDGNSFLFFDELLDFRLNVVRFENLNGLSFKLNCLILINDLLIFGNTHRVIDWEKVSYFSWRNHSW